MVHRVLIHEPFKTLYVVLDRWLTFLVRYPWWILRYANPAWRPRVSWSLSHTLRVVSVRHHITVESRVGDANGGHVPTHVALEAPPGSGVLGLYVDGVKPSLIHEPIASYARAADVHPIRIPGYWQHASSLDLPRPAPQLIMGQPPLPGEKVVYFLHGGGWVSHSAHPSSPLSRIPLYLMEFCAEIGVPVHRGFNIEYRLSADSPPGYGKSRAGGPGTPFPAMLLDALAGYVYLVREVGFKPEQIVVVGDSAGGHLALAFVRYLVDNQPTSSDTKSEDNQVPGLPGGVLLMSPATNLSGTPALPGTSYHANASSDFITVNGSGDPGFRNIFLAGPLGASGLYTNLYLSPSAPGANTPKYADGGRGFTKWPKTFLSAGEAELILTMIRDLEKVMKPEMGERLVYLEAEDSVHDYTAWPSNEPQRTRDLKVMAKWIADL